MKRQYKIELPQIGVIYHEAKPVWVWVGLYWPPDETPRLYLGLVDAFNEEEARTELAEQLEDYEHYTIKILRRLTDILKEYAFTLNLEDTMSTLTSSEE